MLNNMGCCNSLKIPVLKYIILWIIAASPVWSILSFISSRKIIWKKITFWKICLWVRLSPVRISKAEVFVSQLFADKRYRGMFSAASRLIMTLKNFPALQTIELHFGFSVSTFSFCPCVSFVIAYILALRDKKLFYSSLCSVKKLYCCYANFRVFYIGFFNGPQ